jgi:uncharacterized protein (DUF779 family)
MPQQVSATPADVQLGAPARGPVVIDGDHNRRWQHPNFHLDIAAGAAGGFLLEALEDLHLTATSAVEPASEETA